MTGYVQIDRHDIGEITATRSDPWTEAGRARLQAIGFGRAKWLADHVEVKVVAMIVQSGAQHGRIIINHASCGSEPGDPFGCDDVLPGLLPEGRTLTVLGTDAVGNPFKRTYIGKATR